MSILDTEEPIHCHFQWNGGNGSWSLHGTGEWLGLTIKDYTLPVRMRTGKASKDVEKLVDRLNLKINNPDDYPLNIK